MTEPPMTRTPLRPLARILQARAAGENPDTIERENIRLRHEAMRDKSRLRAEGRLLLLGMGFAAAFTLIGPDTGLTPDAGKTSASRQTFVTGRATEAAATALRDHVIVQGDRFHDLLSALRQTVEEQAAR